MQTLTTGQVPKQAYVNIETLRHYERRGLMPKPPNSQWLCRCCDSIGACFSAGLLLRLRAHGLALDEEERR
ncbi:MAG: hypothetical protein C3F08_01075 [Candidatus Methylomirabilota bacterium]|nr:MAG: hypothetical protein C3F08_01075 [candidate division NC10 bacterium]